MVGVDGLEPSNACVSDMCVYQLHHTPMIMEVGGGIEPPFAVLQTAANSSIDNPTLNGCGERNQTFSIGVRDQGTIVMQLRNEMVRDEGLEPPIPFGRQDLNLKCMHSTNRALKLLAGVPRIQHGSYGLEP